MFDLAVIGTGPGGYPAAIRAAQLGLRVVAIEKAAVFGGTCLNVGCIPSKSLLHFTELVLESQGPIFTAGNINFAQLNAHKEKAIALLGHSVQSLLQKNKVETVIGEAKLVNATRIVVNGKEIQAKNILLATGSEPIPLPFLPFDEKSILSSTGALALKQVPQSMIVVGAGVIGVEMASVFARLGTQVTVVELLPAVCSGLDSELSRELLKALENQEIKFLLSTKVVSGNIEEQSVTLQLQNEQVFDCSADVVLVAIGRRPSSQQLNLEKIGVTTLPGGFIQVDSSFRTSVPTVYAIGDLIQGPMLAHRASAEGVAVAEGLAGYPAPPVDYMALPNVIYTSPEAATCGLTEEEVKALKMPYKAKVAPLRGNPRAIATDTTVGFVKVIADEITGVLLGIHILSPHASELIAFGMLALSKKMKVADIADLPFPHPTFSESIKEACLQIADRAIHR